AGAQATIIGRGKPLQHFEQHLAARLVDHTRSLGIELRLDTEVTGVEKRGAGYRLLLDAQGQRETIDADLVIHGGGRVPNTEGLDLRTVSTSRRLKHGNSISISGSRPKTPRAGTQTVAWPRRARCSR